MKMTPSQARTSVSTHMRDVPDGSLKVNVSATGSGSAMPELDEDVV